MKAEQIDKSFDEGEDITTYLDVSKAHRPEHEQRRVDVDFPIWMIHSLDEAAKRLGMPRNPVEFRYLEAMSSRDPRGPKLPTAVSGTCAARGQCP